MAKSETVYKFTVNLNFVEKSLYTECQVVAALHPSETLQRLAARVIAYCYSYEEGIGFSRGLCEPDEPSIWIKDLTGQITCWIDLGLPDIERLEKACRITKRVSLFSYGRAYSVWNQKSGDGLQRLKKLTHIHLEDDLLNAMSLKLTRTTDLSITISDEILYLSIGDWSYQQSMIPLQKPNEIEGYS